MEKAVSKPTYIEEIPNTPLRFLWWAIKPFWIIGLLGTFFGVLSQIISTYVAVFVGSFVDAMNSIADPKQFLWWGVAFTLLMVLQFFAFRLQGFIAIPFILKQNVRSFEKLKAHLLRHSNSYFADRFAGSVTNKVFNAADRGSEMLMMIYFGFVRQFISLFAAAIVFLFHKYMVFCWVYFSNNFSSYYKSKISHIPSTICCQLFQCFIQVSWSSY